MNTSFEFTTFLQYQVKALKDRVASFESGERFQKMKRQHLDMIRQYESSIRALKQELAMAHKENTKTRKHWFEVFDDLQKEHAGNIAATERRIAELENRLLDVERQRDDALDKVTEYRRMYYETATELEDEKGRNQKLLAQLNRDYENSSVPSSKVIARKKISNSRESTGRKPGGQPGHKGHCRRRLDPTDCRKLLPEEEILRDPDFKKTEKAITKQLVNISLNLEVTEYSADVYRNSRTGERYHAPFPDGVVDDVNYGGSVKAFLFLLNNECCVSIDKSRRFLSELTGGKLNISKGMINKLGRVFSRDSEAERKKAYADMLCAPVMHTDCTNARVNGKGAYVFVCAVPEGNALYFAREKKGHEGVKGTVTEDYQGILVHDHESTFFRYGTAHQECLAHVLRALKGSMENERNRTWNSRMRELLRDMVHYRNRLSDEEETDTEKVAEYEKKYSEILEVAEKEYEEIPPGDYYRDGFNLYCRLKQYKDSHLLFLHDRRVPTTNNLAERCLRQYKRKQAQAVSFRSFESIEDLCNSMSVLLLMRQNSNGNIFEKVSAIFNQ